MTATMPTVSARAAKRIAAILAAEPAPSTAEAAPEAAPAVAESDAPAADAPPVKGLGMAKGVRPPGKRS